MDLTTIGLLIIIVGLCGAGIVRELRDSHNKTIIPSEPLDDHERLDQLRSISGGGSLAQIIRIYNVKGKELEKERGHMGNAHKIKLLVRDRILLQHEINRLIGGEVEQEISYCKLI